MLRVALVGNIASGKSTVEKYLTDWDYPVLDTDQVCHRLLVELPEIVEAFKAYDIFEADMISREKFGKLVFNNSELKHKLELILYPKVKNEIEEFFSKNATSTFAFVAIPLLFEAGMESLFDKILFVYCDDDIRLKRLIKRNNYTEEYAKIRLTAQASQEEKLGKSDWVIYNNSSKEKLKDELAKLIAQIR